MSYFEKQYIVCNLIESAEAHIEADNGIVFRSDSSDSVKKMAKDLKWDLNYLDFTWGIDFWKTAIKESNKELTEKEIKKMTDELLDEIWNFLKNNNFLFRESFSGGFWKCLSPKYDSIINSLRNEIEKTKYLKDFVDVIGRSGGFSGISCYNYSHYYDKTVTL